MLKLFLYCSYSGSAVGYQKAVVDTDEKSVRREQGGEIPEPVSYIWTHGGARAAAGWVNGCGYFLAKRIAYTSETKQRDEQGRKVFMNCAFVGKDRQELEQFSNGFLACYKAAVQALGELLVTGGDDISYTIRDFDGLALWMENCLAAGKVAQPRVNVTEKPISFIVLEADWEYFISQCHAASLQRATCPPYPMSMSSEEYDKLLELSQESFPMAASALVAEKTKHWEVQPATPAEKEPEVEAPSPAPQCEQPQLPKEPPNFHPMGEEPKWQNPMATPDAVSGGQRRKFSLLPVLVAAAVVVIIVVVLLLWYFIK